MNELATLNQTRLREVLSLRDAVRARRPVALPSSKDYPLARLRARLSEVLTNLFGRSELDWEMDLLDRSRFGADVALRIPGLMREFGTKTYVAEHVPAVVAALREPALADMVADVTHRGI